MTPDDFVQLVERIVPEVQRKSVLETVQFRVGSKAFATLGWPAEGWAAVKLSAGDQRRALTGSDAFVRDPGRRRNSGVTLVRLKAADPDILADVIGAAWRQAYHGSGRKTLSGAVKGADLRAG